jgi:hypothetical protein
MKAARRAAAIAAVATAATSFAVSYKFFQEELNSALRDLAFRLSADDAERSSTLAASIDEQISRLLLYASDGMSGHPFLSDVAWLRLALPNLVGLTILLVCGVVAITFGKRDRGRCHIVETTTRSGLLCATSSGGDCVAPCAHRRGAKRAVRSG